LALLVRFVLTLLEFSVYEHLVRTLIGILRALPATTGQPAGNDQAQQEKGSA